jgi:hypothetical protein
MNINYLEFENAQLAWEGINKYMIKNEAEILKNGGAIYGPELISYNNFIRIKSLKVDPEFDFGYVMSYKDKKWSALVNNYVHFDYLDLIKSEIAIREAKKARSYNYAYHFANHHGGGKDCLIAMNFSRRVDHPNPIIVFEVRVSEVTQRLLFDLLLIQRIVEYVYGVNQVVEAHFFAPSMFLTGERVMAFNNVKPLRLILKKERREKTLSRFQKQILKKLKYYTTTDPMSIQFRSFRRAAQCVQFDEHDVPLSGAKPLLAKTMQLLKVEDTYPDEVGTPKERQKVKRAAAKLIKASNIPEPVIKKKKKKTKKS